MNLIKIFRKEHKSLYARHTSFEFVPAKCKRTYIFFVGEGYAYLALVVSQTKNITNRTRFVLDTGRSRQATSSANKRKPSIRVSVLFLVVSNANSIVLDLFFLFY